MAYTIAGKVQANVAESTINKIEAFLRTVGVEIEEKQTQLEKGFVTFSMKIEKFSRSILWMQLFEALKPMGACNYCATK